MFGNDNVAEERRIDGRGWVGSGVGRKSCLGECGGIWFVARGDAGIFFMLRRDVSGCSVVGA